jgi:glycosyltransferase involved in cell wall biosynthesis
MKTPAGSRVLMLLENAPFPQDRRVWHEAETLRSAGYQIRVICPADPGQPWREQLNGIRVYRYPGPRGGQGVLGYIREYGYAMLATFALSLLVLARDGFDIIHAANPPDTFFPIVWLYKILGKRFIYDHHDLAPEMYYARFAGHGNRLVHRILLALERISCRLADHVIATNQSYKLIEMQRDKVPEERITVVRNGPEKSLQAVEPDQDLRGRGRTIIAYAGLIGVQDGVDYLVRAIQCLIHDLGRTDAYCVIIGKGDARASCMALVSRLGLDDSIWFTGYLPDADFVRYLSTADICVAPDPSNPFTDHSTMYKLMEYMALAKPIVAFDLPEHRATAERAARYARPNDVGDFARVLAGLMDDPVCRHEMGEFGRKRIETALAWRYSIPHLLHAYEACARNGAKSPREGQSPARAPVSESAAPAGGTERKAQ